MQNTITHFHFCRFARTDFRTICQAGDRERRCPISVPSVSDDALQVTSPDDKVSKQRMTGDIDNPLTQECTDPGRHAVRTTVRWRLIFVGPQYRTCVSPSTSVELKKKIKYRQTYHIIYCGHVFRPNSVIIRPLI
jgi:hypothetical protein